MYMVSLDDAFSAALCCLQGLTIIGDPKSGLCSFLPDDISEDQGTIKSGPPETDKYTSSLFDAAFLELSYIVQNIDLGCR